MFAFLKSHLKKLITALCLFISVFMFFFLLPITRGASLGGDAILFAIKSNTDKILNDLNELPNIIHGLAVFIKNWLDPDNSKETSVLQANFGGIANYFLANQSNQEKYFLNLSNDYFGPNATAQTIPYANDITYATLLDKPFFNPDPRNNGKNPPVDTAYNYIKNASGLNITHVMPGLNWQGTTLNQQRYYNYYTAISAVQTYNAYILSNLYADYQSKNEYSKQQTILLQEASGSDWFDAISKEQIGIVLRQILMFNSQIFVLLTQMLQTQKQMVTAQAMTNTLLIIGNQFTENSLLDKATGAPPSAP